MRIKYVIHTISMLVFIYTLYHMFFLPSSDYTSMGLEIGAHGALDSIDIGEIIEIALI